MTTDTNKHLNNDETYKKPWQLFLEAFGGDSQAVTEEIHAFWQSGEGSAFPEDVYNHLVDNRVRTGQVSPERGDLLKATFAQSFAPDPVTGFTPKHREPLIYTLLQKYAEQHPTKKICHVEGDIVNLGGLNRDIKLVLAQKKGWDVDTPDKDKKATLKRESEALANKVIRVIAGIVREEVAKHGQVAAVRHGGDELVLFVVPNADVEEYAVADAVAAAHKRTLAFIRSTQLNNIAHTKVEQSPGVGIGIASHLFRPEHAIEHQEYREKMERAIDAAKGQFRKDLLAIENKPASLDINALEAALNSPEYRTYAAEVPVQPASPDTDRDWAGDSPIHAAQERLLRKVEAVHITPLTQAERRLCNATNMLCRKIDFVNGLPTFNAFQNKIAPYFEQRHGGSARLVHVDFNNLGGANKLGELVGDAMSRVFRECIEGAMDNLKLKEFTPYLASQGGGKFALLLPAKMPTETLHRMHDEIERQLFRRSQEKLLPPEQEAQVIAKLRRVDEEQYQQRVVGGKAGASESRHRAVLEGGVTIANISSLKSRRKGSNSICVHEEIDLDGGANLDQQMDRLEAKANGLQTTVAGLHERRFQIKKDKKKLGELEENYGGNVIPKEYFLQQLADPESAQIYTKRGAHYSWTRAVKKAEERGAVLPEQPSTER